MRGPLFRVLSCCWIFGKWTRGSQNPSATSVARLTRASFGTRAAPYRRVHPSRLGGRFLSEDFSLAKILRMEFLNSVRHRDPNHGSHDRPGKERTRTKTRWRNEGGSTISIVFPTGTGTGTPSPGKSRLSVGCRSGFSLQILVGVLEGQDKSFKLQTHPLNSKPKLLDKMFAKNPLWFALPDCNFTVRHP